MAYKICHYIKRGGIQKTLNIPTSIVYSSNLLLYGDQIWEDQKK